MDVSPIITTAITALGAILVAWMNNRFKNVIEQIEKTNSRIDDLSKKVTQNGERISKVEESLEDNNLRTMRLDLDRAIEIAPDDTLVIMELGHKYFREMGGNCYMSKKFQKWADDHDIDVSYLFNKN